MTAHKEKILLGYEQGSGDPISIAPSHLIVTGLTQLSGKTTTLEALIRRSESRAIVFKTKIGERVFNGGTLIPPFYRQQSDWQYVASLLEATLKEKMKFERSWVIRACKGTTSLFEVKQNIDNILAGEKLRAMDRDVFTNLQAYFEIVLPQLQYANFSRSLEVRDGINIMDLERFKEEIQSLVIRATLDEVLTGMHDTVVVIPEAWKFMPQGRGNPVKGAAESFIRQGATNGNYLYFDAQDMAGMDKMPLKQVSTWILGLQTERNEVTHTLDQISVPVKQKPKADEIMTLSLGHFVLVTPKMTKHVYAQPIWMSDEDAILIAKGERKSEDYRKPDGMGLGLLPTPQPIPQQVSTPTQPTTTPAQLERLTKDLIQLREDVFNKFQSVEENIRAIASRPVQSAAPVAIEVDVDDIVSRVLLKIPVSHNGTVKIEAKEVVLKRFQQAEVDRLLKQTEGLSAWQKQVLQFVEAKGSQTDKSELLKRILGKTANLVGNYKQRYQEADELATLGFLKNDKQKRLYPNLATHVKSQLETYKATDTEINDVVGQVLLRLQ